MLRGDVYVPRTVHRACGGEDFPVLPSTGAKTFAAAGVARAAGPTSTASRDQVWLLKSASRWRLGTTNENTTAHALGVEISIVVVAVPLSSVSSSTRSTVP